MNDEPNPTLPLAYDIVWFAVACGLLVLAIAAGVSICRIDYQRAGGRFEWSVFVLAVPLSGPHPWFWSGRNKSKRGLEQREFTR